MEYKEYESKLTSMLDNIGNDSANLILDDVATLLTDNKQMNEELSKKDDEIKRLNDLNSRLQKVNGNLLLQIPVQNIHYNILILKQISIVPFYSLTAIHC